MRHCTILAIAGMFVAFTSAAPFKRRDMKYITETQAVIETDWVTKTVWVNGDGSPATSTPQPTISSHAVSPPYVQGPPAVDSVSAEAVSAEAISPLITPAPAAAQSHASTPKVPAAPVASVAPAPAAPAPAPAVSPAAPSTPASSSSGSSSLSGQTFTGQMTHYDVGLGSCGLTSTPDQDVVAIPVGQMDNPGNPNSNPLCGKTVNISYGGKTKQATIVDTCMGCPNDNLDMSNGLFSYFAPLAAGRVGGMTWSLVD